MPSNNMQRINFYVFFAQYAGNKFIKGRSHLCVNKFVSESNKGISSKDATGKPTMESCQEGFPFVLSVQNHYDILSTN
jgi:hypothetical protein